jgi:hypothetical protein
MAKAGEICLWNDARVATTLWFIHLQSREHDPVIRALLDVLRDVWSLRLDTEPSEPRGTARPQRESAETGHSA